MTFPAFGRRHLLVGLAAAPLAAALLAACGDPDAAPADTGPATSSPDVTASSAPPTTAPGTTTSPGTGPAGAAIAHPTGADDVVLRIGFEGGFVAPGIDFLRVPSMLVTGDRRVFQQGAQIMIYPGPLLPAITVATITEDGLQRLLALASTTGLTTDPVPAYDAPMNIADAPDTVVELHAAGGAFVHRAYALGMGAPPADDPTGTGVPVETTPARQHLQEFVQAASDLASPAGGGAVGEAKVFAATNYRVQARVVALTDFEGQDPKPTVAAWPADAGIRLADADDCALATGPVVADVLTKANTNSLFTEDGVTYQLVAIAQLPGDTAC